MVVALTLQQRLQLIAAAAELLQLDALLQELRGAFLCEGIGISTWERKAGKRGSAGGKNKAGVTGAIQKQEKKYELSDAN